MINIKDNNGEYRVLEMSNNDMLIELNKSYDDWVRIASSLLDDTSVAEDIVQEAYIKLLKLDKVKKCFSIKDDGTVVLNKSYMYLTLRSLCYDYEKARAKATSDFLVYDNEAEAIYDDEDTNYTNEGMGDLIERMKEVIQECDWFDKQIFLLYNDSEKSMQKLADEIGISKTAINNSIQKVKKVIREELGEDYEDLKNGEL